MKILITGSKGVIGSVVWERLPQLGLYTIFGFDVKNSERGWQNAVEFSRVMKAAAGKAAIVHLAWDTKTDNHASGRINPDNGAMAQNVLDAAVQHEIGRVVIASSVHADSFQIFPVGRPQVLYGPKHRPANPSNSYGAHKLLVETIAREYTIRHPFLKVVCIRFGGVNPTDTQPDDPLGRAVWLSHADCASLVHACLIKPFPERKHFQIVYGVSDNPGRIHDFENHFDWKPVPQPHSRVYGL